MTGMTASSSALQAFDDHATTGRSALDRAAAAAISATAGDDEMLVIALRPDQDDRRVIASAGNSAVRASISVSIAAGNLRAWAVARANALADVHLAALPEIIRAAIQPSGMQSAQVAAVQHGDERDCLVMWLSRATATTADVEARRALTLEALVDAAQSDRSAAAARLAGEQQAAAEPAITGLDRLPEIDPLETMPGRGEFDKALARLRSDETGLIVMKLDNSEQIVETHGDQSLEAVLRSIATRLASSCRRNDVIARVDDDSFAVLLVDVDRRAAFEISKRLRAQIGEPIELASGSLDVSISVGLSHEAGLVDGVELFVSAESAMVDAHEAGGARMLVAC
jgi:diguanylate cyclase (GGDEF)-like protein